MLLTTELHEVVRRAYPGIDFSMRRTPDGPVIDTWLSETPPPTTDEIAALWTVYIAEREQTAVVERTEREHLTALLVKLETEDLTVLERRRVLRFLLRRALRS